jgi:hypothetical protein
MASLDEIVALMEALGPHDDEIEMITRNGDAEWSVAFDEEAIITLQHVADQHKLMLSMPLATPPTEQRLAAYQAMLSYNLLWQETGGVTLALGGAHGAAYLLFALSTVDLDVDQLDTVLTNFAAKGRIWREAITSGDFGEAGGMAFQDERAFMIRA